MAGDASGDGVVGGEADDGPYAFERTNGPGGGLHPYGLSVEVSLVKREERGQGLGMWRWLQERLRRRPDYRPNAYAHKDLSAETKMPAGQQLKLLLKKQGLWGSPTDRPRFWFRYRKWIILLLALLFGWVLAESLLAWNFFEVSN